MRLFKFEGLMAVCLVLALPFATPVYADSSLSPQDRSGALHRQGVYVAAPPLSVPVGLTLAQVQEAVVNGIAVRNWMGKKQGDNTIQASYAKTHRNQTHKLVLDITFDASTVTINYVSSEGLDYVDLGDGKFGLHKNALRWINNVRADIETQLNRLSLLSPSN